MKMVKVDDRIVEKKKRQTKWLVTFEEFMRMDANTVELEDIMKNYGSTPSQIRRCINESIRRYGYRIRAFNIGEKIYLTKLVD